MSRISTGDVVYVVDASVIQMTGRPFLHGVVMDTSPAGVRVRLDEEVLVSVIQGNSNIVTVAPACLQADISSAYAASQSACCDLIQSIQKLAAEDTLRILGIMREVLG